MPLSIASIASRETRRRSLPVDIHLGEFGDRGHLTQQPQRVEPALLDRARRPRQLRGPAELALDLLDELADLGGRRLGLLVLDPDQRGLVLAIIEEDLEQAVGQQRNGDDGHEQRDIFGEQPGPDPAPPPRRTRRRPRPRAAAAWLAGCRDGGRCSSRPSLARRPELVSRRTAQGYSMTSSASASKVGGISSPVAFAVLRLSTRG